jgi:hypothetical protein
MTTSTTSTTSTTAELLKYADLQMAAEAFLVDSQSVPLTGDLYLQALINGNNHASKFTETQATAFADPVNGWTVLDGGKGAGEKGPGSH